MFEKLKIKIKQYKLLRFVIVTGFVSVALFLLQIEPVSAAKVCDQATSNYCIEILKIEPNSLEQSKDFTVSASLSTQNVAQSLRGRPINFAVRWKVNPSDIADFRDSLTNEVKVSLTPDSNGSSSQNLTQVFNISKAGSTVIGVKLEVLNGTTSMGPQAFDSRQITVKPRTASNTDSVEISNIVSPSSSDTTGRLINFSANYFPAGSSAPVTNGDFIVSWDFGDGTTTVGSTVSHLYEKAGTYNVTVKVQKNGQVVAQNSKSVSVSGNPTEPGNMSNPIMVLINEIIGVLLGFLQELIYQVFFYLIAPLIQAVLSIQVYTDTFAAVIYPGWEVVRNICNIFFVVALIVIAMATLFRVDSYQFRSLLVQLILAALLVNFSLVIAQAILGLADTIQAQFLPSNVEVIRSLAKDLMVKTYRDVYFTNAFSEGSFSGIVKPLFFLALAMGSFAVFAAIAVFLVIRIVVLWVLLLISPMAYAVGVLPSTAGYRKQWWDMFLKYAFFTPIMAFFLNLTAVIANTYNTNPILQQINSPELQAQLGGSTIATFVFKVASNILLLVFLMAALKVADMAGIYGASAITSVAQKGILAPFAGAGWASKVAFNNLQRFKRDKTKDWSQESQPFYKKVAFAALNAGMVRKAFEKDSLKNQERAEHFAEAAALDVKRQTPGFREKGLPSELAEAQLHHIQGISKERPYTGFEELEVDKAVNYEKLARTSDKYKAIYANQLLQLFENKGGNALLANGIDGKTFGWTREGVNAFLAQMVKNGSLTKQMAGELNSSFSKIGYDTKQTVLYEGVSMHGVHPELFDTEEDPNHPGEYKITGQKEYEKIQKFVLAKVNEILEDENSEEYQTLVNNRYKKYDENGNVVEMSNQEKLSVKDKYRAEIMNKFINQATLEHKGAYYEKYKEDLHNLKPGNVSEEHYGHNVHNYSLWVKSMAQARNNITKSKSAASTLQDAHWNSIWHEVDGVTHLQDGAITALFNIQEDKLFQAGRGIQEKTLVGLQEAVRREDVLLRDFEDRIRENYRQSGKDPMIYENQIRKQAKVKVAGIKAVVEASKNGQIAGKAFLAKELAKINLPPNPNTDDDYQGA